MLSLRQRRWLYGLLLGLFASGLLHFVLRQWFGVEGEFGPMPHPAEAWLLRLHGALAMAGLLALGGVFTSHVLRHLPERRNRVSGLGVLALVALLILSAYGLYYGGDALRTASRWSHLGIGLLALPLTWWHVRSGMRERRLRRRSRGRRRRSRAAGHDSFAAER